jgi:phage gpG-like protein
VARDGVTVSTDGLRDFRRDLRRLEPEVDKELRKELRQAVAVIAARAAQIAPRQSGALARSYRPFVTQRSAGIRSALPYAPVIEYGGTISPRGAEIRFAQRLPVTTAVEQYADRLVEEFSDAVERAWDQSVADRALESGGAGVHLGPGGASIR